VRLCKDTSFVLLFFILEQITSLKILTYINLLRKDILSIMIKHILHRYFPAHTLYILQDLNEETDLVIVNAWFVFGNQELFFSHN